MCMGSGFGPLGRPGMTLEGSTEAAYYERVDALLRLSPRQPEARYALSWRHEQFDPPGLSAQEQAATRVHVDVWGGSIGLVRAIRRSHVGHHARKTAKEIASRLED